MKGNITQRTLSRQSKRKTDPPKSRRSQGGVQWREWKTNRNRGDRENPENSRPLKKENQFGLGGDKIGWGTIVPSLKGKEANQKGAFLSPRCTAINTPQEKGRKLATIRNRS